MATIVVKVGSSTLTGDSGGLDRCFIGELAVQIAAAWAEGHRVVLVTSGAISAGAERLGLKERPRALAMKQAAAAVGQGLLMEVYSSAFAAVGRTVAQVLITREDTAERSRYVNARHTLSALLRLGVVPVVNENDTVSVDEIREIRFGENDTLSALVAALVEADLLVLLTDVAGFFGADGTVIPTISEITPDLFHLAGGAGSQNGTGGMVTKLQAATIAGEAGIPTIVARGREPGILENALRGDPVGTRFVPPPRR